MADTYTQSLLADGETIRAEARQHWVALIRFATQPIAIFVVALVALGVGIWLTPEGDGLLTDILRWIDTILGLATAALIILALAWLPIQAYRWTRRRFLVTERRVLYVEGVLRRTSVDAGLNMITDVGFRQSFLGQKLGYGDLAIATASNRPITFRQMRDAMAFKRDIMAAQHATIEARADEILQQTGRAPGRTVSPPAAVVAVETVEAVSPATVEAVEAVSPATVETAPVPEEPPAPPVPAWDGTDVPQMAEDDVAPADPSIFGTHPPEDDADADEPAPVAASSTDPPSAPWDGTDVPHMAEDDVAAADPAIFGTHPPRVEAEPEPVVEPEVEVVAEPEPVVEPEPEVVAEPVAESEPVAEAEPEPEVVAEPEPVVEPGPEPVVAPGDHMTALAQADASVAATSTADGPLGADTITDAIARLATLRDSGALTDEDFETKKQELLDRL
ncbi:MAG: PH domain-containing protein [Chloroflexi bacterium]|nr:PH domain-containing protein [Chloroflexota bacterium]